MDIGLYFFLDNESRQSSRRPADSADLLLPAALAAVQQPRDTGRAATVRHQQLPQHRHGQLHAVPQHRGRLR